MDTDPAILQLRDHTEDKVPLDADHSQIVKFNSRNDKGHKSVLEGLKQLQQDAPGVVAARFSKWPSKKTLHIAIKCFLQPGDRR